MAEETPEGNEFEAGDIEGGEDQTEEEGELTEETVQDNEIEDLLEQEMLQALEEETEDEEEAISTEDNQLPTTSTETPDRIEQLSKIDVTVTVELGGNFIPIKEILSWNKDSIVKLEPEEEEPVGVLVNGKLFARGKIVVVGDTFGVRIVELVTQSDNQAL